jgi:hypothetical protein
VLLLNLQHAFPALTLPIQTPEAPRFSIALAIKAIWVQTVQLVQLVVVASINQPMEQLIARFVARANSGLKLAQSQKVRARHVLKILTQ